MTEIWQTIKVARSGWPVYSGTDIPAWGHHRAAYMLSSCIIAFA